jgi:hypothetical protein
MSIQETSDMGRSAFVLLRDYRFDLNPHAAALEGLTEMGVWDTQR